MAPRSSVCTPGEGWRGRGTSFTGLRAQPCLQSCQRPRPQSCPLRRAPQRAPQERDSLDFLPAGPRGPGGPFSRGPSVGLRSGASPGGTRWSIFGALVRADQAAIFLRGPVVGLRPGTASGATRWSIFGALVRADQAAIFLRGPVVGLRPGTASGATRWSIFGALVRADQAPSFLKGQDRRTLNRRSSSSSIRAARSSGATLCCSICSMSRIRRWAFRSMTGRRSLGASSGGTCVTTAFVFRGTGGGGCSPASSTSSVSDSTEAGRPPAWLPGAPASASSSLR